jgi:hypothetical protein
MILAMTESLLLDNPIFHYELFISGFGSCGMIQSINALGERVCM